MTTIKKLKTNKYKYIIYIAQDISITYIVYYQYIHIEVYL